MTDDLVTLTYVTGDAELVEHDVPAHVAEAIARGEAVSWTGGETRRFSAPDGKARLLAARDQHRSRMDELVTKHPSLKSQPRRKDSR